MVTHYYYYYYYKGLVEDLGDATETRLGPAVRGCRLLREVRSLRRMKRNGGNFQFRAAM